MLIEGRADKRKAPVRARALIKALKARGLNYNTFKSYKPMAECFNVHNDELGWTNVTYMAGYGGHRGLTPERFATIVAEECDRLGLCCAMVVHDRLRQDNLRLHHIVNDIFKVAEA